MKISTGKHIIIGLSGGVDSSVSALLLKEQGFNVHAVFMKNWQSDDDDRHCSAEQDAADAKAVCAKLDIPLSIVNFSQDYWDRVFQHFLDEYQAGRTPNPDILCNTEIKFKAFLDYALNAGADAIATGHYVQTQQKNGESQLLKGADPSKDQTYFLHGLSQHQLAHSIFPIGHLEKSQVRDIAQKAGLVTYNKKDSTGICFIGERKFKNFLQEYLPAKPGNIETETGQIIGKHDGLMYYTIGQRKGLNIGGLKNFSEAPWYVLQKDLKRNVLVAGQNEDHPALLKKTLIAKQAHWIAGKPPSFPLACQAKIRYRQEDQNCRVECTEKTLHVTFDKPQRAVTPGQYVVFYQGNLCLGGAVIHE